MLWESKIAHVTTVNVKYVNIITCLYRRKVIMGWADENMGSLQSLICSFK